MAKGKRAQAAKAAAPAAVQKQVNQMIKDAGKAISKSELDAINKIITGAKGTAVSFEDTQSAAKRAEAAKTGGNVNKTAVGVDTTTDAQGNVIRTTTWSDGSSSSQNLGPSGATQAQRTDWIAELTNTFTNYGLSSLVPKLTEFIRQGYSYDTVTIRLQDTPEYKQRFAGNELRRKAGLPVLSPGEYLNLEQGYRQVARSAGLPEGFYDSLDDFTNFIANDVSPVEYQERVDLASNAIMNSDPFYTDTLRRLYGLDSGEMIAYVLDPQRALPALSKVARAVEFGTAAARQGFTPAIEMAEQYAGMGVGGQQAEQGFQAIGQILPTTQRLGNVFSRQVDGQYGLEEATSEVFGGPMSAEAIQRRRKLSEMEQSLFAGQSGVGRGTLGRSQTGQF
jgi:hypothetical protein